MSTRAVGSGSLSSFPEKRAVEEVLRQRDTSDIGSCWVRDSASPQPALSGASPRLQSV